MQATASRLLTEYGETVTVSRANIVFVDPATGIATEGSPTNYSGVGHPSLYQKPYIDNVTVLSTDVRLLFYSTTTPIAGDVFTIDNTDYTAVNVFKTRAQGDNIIYTVQLRQ